MPLQIAEEAAAGLWTIDGEAAAAQWLDAEDATTAAVLTWAAEHDLDTALRLAAALGLWWELRGQAGQQARAAVCPGRPRRTWQFRMARLAVVDRPIDRNISAIRTG